MTETKMDRSLDYYLKLPYTIRLVPDAGETWFVDVAELPGCMSVGNDPEDAVTMIRDAMRAWLEVALADGQQIPEPRELSGFSGRFVARVPRSLHRDLVEAAESEGVSLNQFVSAALAMAVGERKGLRAGQTRRQSDPLTTAASPVPAPAAVYLPAEPRPMAAHLAEPAPDLAGGEPPSD